MLGFLKQVDISPLKVSDFRVALFSATVSFFGDGVTSVALVFAVLETTNSVSDVGLVLSSRVIPQIILLLAGGAIADRHRRDRVMALSQLASAAFQGMLATFLLIGEARIWVMMVLYAGLGCAQAIFKPASSGLIPQLIEKNKLPAANGLMSMGQSTGQILGPAVGGLVVAVSSPGIAIAIDAATFAVSSILLWRIKNARHLLAASRARVLRDLAEGWSLVRSRQWLWAMIGFFGFFQFAVLSGLFVLGPEVARLRLGGASAWGVMLAASGIGALVGGALALRWRARRLLVRANVTVLGVVPVFVVLSLGAPEAACVAAMFLFGCALAYADTLWMSTLQSNVPTHMLSRVASYDYFGTLALRPLGLALVGPLALLVGTNAVLLGNAVVVVVGVAILLSLPKIRHVGIPDIEVIEPESVVAGGAAGQT